MIEEHDAVMYEMPSVGVTKPSDQGPFPFVGNGLLGTAAIYDSSNSLFLFHRNSDQKIQLLKYLPIPFVILLTSNLSF